MYRQGPQFEMPRRPPGLSHDAVVLDATAALLAIDGQLGATWGYAYLLSDRIHWIPAEDGLLTSPGEVQFVDVLEVDARDYTRSSSRDAFGVDIKTADHEFSLRGMDQIAAQDWASHVHASSPNLVPPGTAVSKRRFRSLLNRRALPFYALFILIGGTRALRNTSWWDPADLGLLLIAGFALLAAAWLWTHRPER